MASLIEKRYDAIILAVARDQFRELSAAGIHALGKGRLVPYDIRSMLSKDEIEAGL